MPLDVPWLSHQANQAAMSDHNIPLETLPPPPIPPPAYHKSQSQGADAVHNHYHIGQQQVPRPWYRRKWVLWSLAGALVFFVVIGLIIMGVMLKLELGKKAASDETPAFGTTVTASSTRAASKKGDNSATATSSEPEATATPFTMLATSQLASAFVKTNDAAQTRRVLIRQEDTLDLLVTEWTHGQMTHYRLRDRLDAKPVVAKPETPLALQVDDTGTIHLFYVSGTNLLSYLYQPSPGQWKAGEISSDHGAIRTSAHTSLSTAWHNGYRASRLLVVAFDNPSQQLQLAIAGSPSEPGAWYIVDVTSVSRTSVPGQSNIPCYSLAGDLYSQDAVAPEASTQDIGRGNQHMLLAVADGAELHAWECSVDFWPPPDVQARCRQADDRFRTSSGENITLVPAPLQISWVYMHGNRKDTDGASHDYLLLSRDGTATVREQLVGAGIVRWRGDGFTAPTNIKAMSTTLEGMLFASSGKDVFVYAKRGDFWEPDVSTNVAF
ncbi:hypothetical protein E4U61_003529 [Claviceps capensis]|nr:hypothetical protein E4U61_003529 [Claviceps capensis]